MNNTKIKTINVELVTDDLQIRNNIRLVSITERRCSYLVSSFFWNESIVPKTKTDRDEQPQREQHKLKNSIN